MKTVETAEQAAGCPVMPIDLLNTPVKAVSEDDLKNCVNSDLKR